MNLIQHIDHWLLLVVNKILANSIFDALAPLLREKLFWTPVYIFVLNYAACNLSKFRFWFFVGGLAISVGVADQLSSNLIKPLVGRERPCRSEALTNHLITRVPCGPGASFTSSHAANHFAAAFVFVYVLGASHKLWKPLSYLWASSVAWAQVYVGVHFPSDVVVGAILGISVAKTIMFVLEKYSSTLQGIFR